MYSGVNYSTGVVAVLLGFYEAIPCHPQDAIHRPTGKLDSPRSSVSRSVMWTEKGLLSIVGLRGG
jgi:hypothetical protein